MSTLASVILRDLLANRPAASIPGRLFYATDTTLLYRDNGTSWDSYSVAGAVSSLTTTGSSGAATLSAGVLNIPVYAGGGGAGLFGSNIGTVPTLAGTGLTTSFGSSAPYSAANTSNGITLQDLSTGVAGTSKYEGQVKAYPGAAYTATALLSLPVNISSNSQFPTVGLVIMDTLTGKLITFRAALNTNWGYDAYSWTAPNAGATNIMALIQGSVPSFIWLRLKDNGTTVVYSVSSDGCYFTTIGTLTKSSSILGASGFNFLGVFVNPQNIDIGTTLMSWTITNP